MLLKGESRSCTRKIVEAKLLGKSLLYKEEGRSDRLLKSLLHKEGNVEAKLSGSCSYIRKAIAKRNCQGIELLYRLRSITY